MAISARVETKTTREFCKRMREAGIPSFKDIEYQVTLETLMRDYIFPQLVQVDLEDVTPENVKELQMEWRKVVDEWRDVCMSDPEIEAFCKPTVKRLLEQHKDCIKHLEKWFS